jgi:Sulfotransferase family
VGQEQEEVDDKNDDDDLNFGEKITTPTSTTTTTTIAATTTTTATATKAASSASKTSASTKKESVNNNKQLQKETLDDEDEDEGEMKDLPDGVEIEVDLALDFLRRCRTFSCIQKGHGYLGSRRTLNETEYPELDDFPIGVEVDVNDALTYLRLCHTFECIKKAHGYLAGRTRFNFPHYFLTGWQKCATTSVNAYFRHHPQYMWGLRKESHWFSQCKADLKSINCHAKSPSDYMREFLRLEEAAVGGLEHVTFDASVDYAQKGESLAAEIYDLFPWIKIVLILREPISRIISYSRMYTEKNNKAKGCFGESDLYDCLRPYFQEESPRSGHYDAAMEGWLKYFPAEQIKVVQFEELQEDPNRMLHEIKLFLGMDPQFPDIVLQITNSRRQGGYPMELEKYQDLVATARPKAQRLAAMLEKAGLAKKEEWMARWQFVWNRQMTEDCDDQGKCLVNSN